MRITSEAIGFGADMLWAQRAGRAALDRRQQRRFAALVADARSRSPLYRRLYAGLPQALGLDELPVVDKGLLNEAFDEWVTDARLTRSGVEAFISDPQAVGMLYLDDYFVCTSSGTTGRPGLFVHDRRACAVYLAMFARLDAAWLSPRDLVRMELSGGRVAAVIGSGAHFAGASWVELMRGLNPRWRRSWRLISAQSPPEQIVAELNEHDPAIVLIYPSSLEGLIDERRAGRLTIDPLFLEVGGESMSLERQAVVAEVFGCPVRMVYGASEFDPLAFSCDAGWLHSSSDWSILEPVQADGTPTPPGEASHTVLLTNLANRAAPIIRYDLGDSVLAKDGPCDCGSPLPALQVAGRSDETLEFIDPTGARLAVPPLALGAVVDRVLGPELTQVVQTSPESVEVRLRVSHDADDSMVWESMFGELRTLFDAWGLSNVTISRSDREARMDPTSGKFRHVVRAEPT